MTKPRYERLTALDNSFLVFEKRNAFMHVASTCVFEAGPLRRADGGIDAEAIRNATLSALPFIPRYRQKLAYAPFSDRAMWVDDERFNIDYHIRHTSLPRPGSDEQLKLLSARIMEQHLDRSRPLWEMWVVEGLEGDRFALVSKVHHCMVDGIAGVELLTVLLDPVADAPRRKPAPFIPHRAPTSTELLCDTVLRRASLPFKALGDLQRFWREADDARREIVVRARAVSEMVVGTLRRPSETPLNHEIGPHRRFDWKVMDLARLRELRARLGGSLNDIVLAVVTGAVQDYLSRRRINPGAVDFRVMAPVSVRTDDERGAGGNRISAWLIDLPLQEADPREQLARIREQTAELKNTRQAVAAEVLTGVAEWSPSTLVSLAGRNVTRVLPFNMVVTNVPGPQFPMYLAGARLLEAYPMVPLTDNLGLGIALLSYDGKIYWGINADYDSVPDTSEVVEGIERAMARLAEAAGQSESVGRPQGLAASPDRSAEPPEPEVESAPAGDVTIN